MLLQASQDLKEQFPGLRALVAYVDDVKVAESAAQFQKAYEELSIEVRQKYTLDSLKDVPILRAYRDFFWRVGIDPTKVRPAAEALIRRILSGKTLPRINNLVDAYNLASIKTEIALAAFTRDRLKGDLLMRWAKEGEEFLGIGMNNPIKLTGIEVVISDSEKLVAIYPHRDAETSKISNSTTKVLMLVCGMPGIEPDILEEAGEVATSYIVRFCGGKISSE
jgi:DNA/RNA-binding domain of Phe-tRNA-synthetase-like protein